MATKCCSVCSGKATCECAHCGTPYCGSEHFDEYHDEHEVICSQLCECGMCGIGISANDMFNARSEVLFDKGAPTKTIFTDSYTDIKEKLKKVNMTVYGIHVSKLGNIGKVESKITPVIANRYTIDSGETIPVLVFVSKIPNKLLTEPKFKKEDMYHDAFIYLMANPKQTDKLIETAIKMSKNIGKERGVISSIKNLNPFSKKS
jgi:hypothetical protein